LRGLVLAGGRSTRMQSDKSLLEYHGKPQVEWAAELIAPFCTSVHVAVRAGHAEDAARAGLPAIADEHDDAGPMAGIAAAQNAYPDAAWFVVACDLPFLDATTLAHLTSRRDPARVATAYRSAHDGLPEPLCAIWEPSSRALVRAAMEEIAAAGSRSRGRRSHRSHSGGSHAHGSACPRGVLESGDALLLDLPDPGALDNVNTRDEWEAACARLAGGASEPTQLRRVRVEYYATLREQAGMNDETIETSARTPAQLYAELARRHAFDIGRERLKVAVNAQFRGWSEPLHDGDEVVFIPPVAGG
jgi:molybdopterin-guanine dinucleotide biosynthesis protein A